MAALDDWPFRGSVAVTSGALSARELKRFYTAVYPGVYAPRWVELTARQRAQAAWIWSRGAAVVAGLSAAGLHGAKWIEPTLPAQLIHSNRRPPAMLQVHSDALLPGETLQIDGMAVTTPARTAFDLARWLPVTEAVQRVDALMNATGLTVPDIQSVAKRHAGARGLVRLRTTIALVDGGAESPYESLTRLMLIRGSLPAPETQIHVTDEYGGTVAYLDMGWRRSRVAVEYDGVQHWTDARQRRRDIERLATLDALGWIVIRVTSDMLRTPAVVVERARAALASR